MTFIKWRLTPSYAAKDTIFWQKRPKTIVMRIIVRDNKNSNLFIWPSMWTRLEHAHCLETINNMWFLGKRESVNVWKKERKMNRSEVSSKWNKCRIFVGDLYQFKKADHRYWKLINYALTWARPDLFLSMFMPVARMLQQGC
jgi:hypothetical protein